jgi:hypothetical protein
VLITVAWEVQLRLETLQALQALLDQEEPLVLLEPGALKVLLALLDLPVLMEPLELPEPQEA